MNKNESFFGLNRKPALFRPNKPRDAVFASAIADFNGSRILSKGQINKISAMDFPEAVKAFCDAGYTYAGDENTFGILENSGIDGFIGRQIDTLNDYAYNDCASDYALSIAVNPFYYNNIKLYYKMRILNDDLSSYAYKLEDEYIKQAINSGEYDQLNDFMKKALDILDRTGGSKKLSGKEIDDIFTTAMFSDSFYCAGTDKLLKDVVNAQIDCYNFVTFNRCRRMKKTWNYCFNALIDGGKIVLGEFENFYGKDEKEIASKFNFNNYDFLEQAFNGKAAIDFSADIECVRVTNRLGGSYGSQSFFLNYYYSQLLEYKIAAMILTLIKNDKRKLIESKINCLYELR